MNPILVKKALEKVLNANILVVMISHRVRQLNANSGSTSRPLVTDVTHLGAADIALREIIEGKMSFEAAEIVPLTRPTGKDRNRPKHWTRS